MFQLLRRGFAIFTSLAIILNVLPSTTLGSLVGLQIEEVYAAPCNLGGANVQPASLVAGTTNQVTFSFTTCDVTVANSNINITFPSGFNVASASGGTCSLSGSYSTSVAGQVVTISRTGGTNDAAGQSVVCTMNNITNPATTGSTGTYSAQITGGSDPQRDFNIPADTIVADAIAPTVTISSTASNPTNTSPIPVTVTFSENVTGFVVGDLTIGNGSASGFAGGPAVYTFNLTPSGQGNVTVDIAAGVAQDSSSNPNTAATQFSRTFDSVQPTVSISSAVGNPTNTSPIPVTVTFSEGVTGFVVGDLSLGNASASNFSGSGTTYTFDLTPAGQGTVTVDIAGGVAQDSATNNNTAATQFSRTFDSAQPTVTISSTASDPTNSSTIPVTVTFSENVTGFVVGDLTLSNGSASNFSGSGTTYTFDLTPAGQGAVTVNIAGGVAVDSANNGNTAAAQFSRTFDSVQPTVTISSTAPNPTNTSPIPVTVTFNESVTGFVVTDLNIGNGSASNFSGSGTTYTFDLIPAGQGSVTVDIAGAVAVDAANNGNTAATQFSRTFDTSQPTVTISSASSNPTGTSPIPVTVTFSESVTGFVVGDLTLGNGSASNFTGSGTTYTFDLTPSAQGTVTVDIAGNVAQDAAGNNNTAATQFSRTFDSVQPTVTITSTATNPTNTSPIPVTVTFSESVTGFVVGDLTLGNGTASNFAGASTTYTFDLTPSAQGSVTVDIAGGVAVDAANNSNSAAVQFSRTFDSVQPTITITSTAPNPTNANIPVTITFSEDVTGFVVGEVTAGNGTISNFTPASATVYTFDLTPTAEGAVTVDVAAGVAADAANNTNTAATQFSRTFDSLQPTVTISSTSPNPTNTSPIPVTVTFSESVTGFVVGDLTLGNSSASNFSGSGTTYTFELTPAGQGTVTVDIAGGVAADNANNNNTAAAQFSRTFDSVQPSLTISSTAPNPTNANIPVTITFSEDVTGFVVSDVTAGNGNISNFTPVSATVYTFDLTPTAEGTVTIDVAGGVAVDAANNSNSAATQFSRTFDSLQPSVTISSAAGNPTNISPIPVTITFNESVTGFTVGDLTLGNGSASNFAGAGTTYTFDLTPAGQGTVTVDVAGAVAVDAANNGNTAATQFSRTFDSVQPTVTITSTAPNPTNAMIPVTVTFSESVNGFAAGDLTLGNGTASNFSGSGTTYTFDLTPSAQGTVTVDIAAGVATDDANNGNTIAVQLSRTFDSVQPSVTIDQAGSQADPTNASPINFTVVFSENVTGFDNGDITLAGTAGATTAVVTGGPATYNVAVSGMTSDGTIIASVNSGVASDSATNTNTASTSTDNTVTFDGAQPSVTITSGTTSPTNSTTIPVTITFSENVSGFDLTDITVGNGSAADFAGGPAVYTINVTPAADGVVTVDVAAGRAQDSGSNLNTAATQFSITYDSTAPDVTITSGASDPTNGNIPLTVTFNEAVTGFTAADLNVSNASVTGFAGGPAVYTFSAVPTSDGLVTVDIAGSTAVDLAGNNNNAASQFSITFDGTAPSVVISSLASSPTNTSPIAVTVTFSESVNDFLVGDLSIGNGSASNFAGAGMVYTFDLTPAGDGVVTVDVPTNAAQDNAGNNNTAATQFSITYDASQPTVTINQDAGQVDPTNGSPINFTVVFSENVTGFDGTDVVLGGTAGATNAVVTGGPSTYNVAVSGMSANGNVTASINAGAAADVGANTNLASTSTDNTVTYDATQPGVTISSGTPDPFNFSPFLITITFDESVSGFDLTDITVAGGSAGNFSGSGTTYNAEITPSAPGLVTVDVNSAVAQDSAGNTNTAATTLSRVFDSDAPTVTLTPVITVSNSSSFSVTATFSESMVGFDVTDLSVSNANVNNFAGGGNVYTFDLAPLAEGPVTAQILAGVATDAASNNNFASNLLSYTYDITAPSVTVEQEGAQLDPTNGSPINFTVSFSENVIGFDNADVTLSGTAGATMAVVTGGPSIYNVAVSGMTSDGTVIASVNAGGATDSAFNSNTASTSTDNTVTYDVGSPTVLDVNSSTTSGTYTAGQLITITVTFSEPVVVSGTPQLTLETGTTDAVVNYTSGSGTNVLTFEYTIGSGENSLDLDYVDPSSLTLNGGTIQDTTTNNATLTLPAVGGAGSLGANTSFVIDNTGPSLTSWTLNLDTQQLTLNFDEAVDASTLNATGLTVQDAATATTSFTLTGGTTTSPDGTTIVITLVPADATNIGTLSTFFLRLTTAVIDDLVGNNVNAINDGSAVLAASVVLDANSGPRSATGTANVRGGGSTGGGSTGGESSGGGVLGATTERRTLEDQGVNGGANGGGSDVFTEEIIVYPFKTRGEQKDVLTRLKQHFGESFKLRGTIYGATPGRNGTSTVGLINPALNVISKGTKVPRFIAIRDANQITLSYTEEITFLRPVKLQVKNIGTKDWKDVRVLDKYGKELNSFQVSEEEVLTIWTNYVRDLTIYVTTPVEVELLPDAVNDPEHEAIKRLMELGVIKGHPDGTFKPGNPLKRSETAKMIGLLLGMKPDANKTGDEWYSSLQRALATAAMIKGSIPAETIELRANFLALVAKAKGINITTLPACSEQTFADVPTDKWYCPLVQHAVKEGWIRETSGNFDPSGMVIRSWAAGILDRAF